MTEIKIEKLLTDTEEKELMEKAILEGIKGVKNPFHNLTVKDVMKDLLCGEAKANEIFKRPDFPSVNIGKTKTVTYLAYLVWKSTRKNEESDDNGNINE